MQKEIGSNFWVDRSALSDEQCFVDIEKLGISGEDTVFLSSGRKAIEFAIEDAQARSKHRIKKAMIPPFTCETVIQPFMNQNLEICTYDINLELNTNSELFERCIVEHNPDIVLIHRFFGFDTASDVNEIIENYTRQGVIFIEDRTQNLFSGFSCLNVDYVVGSFRKWDAISDGGYCVKSFGKFDIQKPNKTDNSLVEHKIRAFDMKYKYMIRNIGEKKDFLESYALAEHILDEETSYFTMSNVSMNYFNSIDKLNLVYKRRENYERLYEGLCFNDRVEIKMGLLPDNVVPLYFVLFSTEREQLQLLLRKQSIYAPIVWPKADICPIYKKEVDHIYSSILCIPIDQRYDIDDMDRIVSVINTWEK